MEFNVVLFEHIPNCYFAKQILAMLLVKGQESMVWYFFIIHLLGDIIYVFFRKKSKDPKTLVGL